MNERKLPQSACLVECMSIMMVSIIEPSLHHTLDTDLEEPVRPTSRHLERKLSENRIKAEKKAKDFWCPIFPFSPLEKGKLLRGV
jgi:hypothetical protein